MGVYYTLLCSVHINVLFSVLLWRGILGIVQWVVCSIPSLSVESIDITAINSKLKIKFSKRFPSVYTVL